MARDWRSGSREASSPVMGVLPDPQGEGCHIRAGERDHSRIGIVGKANGHALHLITEPQNHGAAAGLNADKVQGGVAGEVGENGVEQRLYSQNTLVDRGVFLGTDLQSGRAASVV